MKPIFVTSNVEQTWLGYWRRQARLLSGDSGKYYGSLQKEVQLIKSMLTKFLHLEREWESLMNLKHKDLLLQLDNGTIKINPNDNISLLNGRRVSVSSIQDFINQVFPNIKRHLLHSNWLCDRAILAPKYQTVDNINWKLLQEILK